MQTSRAGILTLFEHMAQLLNRGSMVHRLYNFSSAHMYRAEIKTTKNNI